MIGCLYFYRPKYLKNKLRKENDQLVSATNQLKLTIRLDAETFPQEMCRKE